MPILYYRWIKTTSVDFLAATRDKNQQIRSHYIQAGRVRESTSAVWLFRLDPGCYHPGAGILADRSLVRIAFTAEGEAIMEHPDNHIDFESDSLAGEAAHPLKIIVKANEPGARGIGVRILEFLNARIKKIDVASPAEIKKAQS